MNPWGMKINTYCMAMHLSQLASLMVPGLGLALPIVMWVANKDRFPEIDDHGKVIMNWGISLIIYMAVSMVLWIILIGMVSFGILVILNIVFIIMGAVRANEGIVWPYPLSIKFFRMPED